MFKLDGNIKFINIDSNYIKKLNFVCPEVYYKSAGYDNKPYIGILINEENYEQPFSWWESWGKSSFNNAGTTLLVAGIISFFIEISTLRSFFQDSMKNILNDDFPLDAYSEENL